MGKPLFPKELIVVEIDNELHIAEYIGREEGFECCVCGKGENCYVFNIYGNYDDYENGRYESWGYGREHLNRVNFIREYPIIYGVERDSASMSLSELVKLAEQMENTIAHCRR